MDIEDLKVKTQPTADSRCFRCKTVAPLKKKIIGFSYPNPPTNDEIVAEAHRCIYCYDAQCSKCCPAQLDIKEFVHAAAADNWYYAAKVILTSNPLPLSTGCLCSVRSWCQGGCNLKDTLAGPIKTNAIQLHAIRQFRKYNLKPLVPPSIGKKVAIVGAGPSGLSCAAFLRRFGIDVTIFEKEKYAGGLLMSELLPYRLPLEDNEFEIQMIKDMGVEFKFEQTLGKDFTVNDLIEKQGFSAVYLAFGRLDDTPIRFECKGAINSHQFLREICGVLKLKNGKELPNYTGKKVLVLGAGETAVDCASAASRLGGEVTIAFRKDFKGMRMQPYDVEELNAQGVEFLPLAAPVSINDGEVKFRLQERVDDKTFKELDEYLVKKYDVVITAFGTMLGEESTKIVPGKLQTQKVEGFDNVFAGGDLANSFFVVEAVNDAKVAAKMIAEKLGITGEIPVFKTEVDNVSLETTVDGLKYVNPFGLASCPNSGTYEMIKRAFEAGFGWVATKTIILDKDVTRDNDLRIVKCDINPGPSNSFFNICMMTEHTMEYWLETVKKLKQEFPDRIIICSMGCQDIKEDWQYLTKELIKVGADGFELNLSCPNEPHGEGGAEGGFKKKNGLGMALGTDPESIKRITEYVKEVAGGRPVYPKLTPNITEIVEIAEGAVNGKAEGIATINTISGLPKFFPDGNPFPQVGTDKNCISGGLSGDMVRPVALRDIARIHNQFPQLSILGIGGIWNAYTALQHLYAGANLFEVCSGIQRYSVEIIREMLSGLQFYLYSWSKPNLTALLSLAGEMENLPHKEAEKSFDKVPCVNDLRGIGAKHLVERSKLDLQWTVAARINPDKCVNCGKCALTCRDNSEECIARGVDGKWKVDDSKCVGCGLCMSVCPFKAIDLVRVKDKPWHYK